MLAPVDGSTRAIRLDGHEARLLALLATAYNRSPTPSAMAHIRKATQRWSEGDEGRAGVHLALTGLGRLEYPSQAAHRLFLADGLMNASIEPEAVLKALGIDTAVIDPLLKDYREQPRVPAGNGRPSGQWTSDGTSGQTGGGTPNARTGPPRALVGPVPSTKIPPTRSMPGPGSWLAGLSDPKLKALGTFALRAGGAAVLFNLVLVPNKSLRKEGVIPGQPPLHYYWNQDERSLILTYAAANRAQHVVSVLVGMDGLLRDQSGQVIGRILPNSYVAIDRTAVMPRGTGNDDNMNFCPKPEPDKFHLKGLDFEDHMKRLINPENPTPRGFGIQRPNPFDNGKEVNFDDCQHRTGILFDYKGPGYATMLAKGVVGLTLGVLGKLHEAATRQIEASEGRPIVWIFAEKAAAADVKAIFDNDPKIGHKINVAYERWEKCW